MAHNSGYLGLITFTSGDPGWNLAITRWSLHHEIRTHEVTEMGDTVRARITGLGDWRARVDFLVPVAAGSGAFDSGDAVTVRFIINGTPSVPVDYFTGTGIVESYDTESPLDGPISSTCIIVGNGALTWTQA